MDKIRHGRGGAWIVPYSLFLRLFVVITAQPGFLSISCGGKTNHTENNITWVTDAGYIDVGQPADIGDASALGSYLHSIRYFPKPLNKSCYRLPVTPHVPHLLRLWFVPGNFRGGKIFPSFNFSIETLDILAMQPVGTSQQIDRSDAPYQINYENIFVTSGRVLYICLVRSLSTDDPFISAIELRRLQHDMYQSDIGGRLMVLQSRYDVGGNSVVRYPQDKFDRIWTPSNSSSLPGSKEPISTTNTQDLPPTAVMQTASVTLPETPPFLLNRTFESRAILLVLYFAEIEAVNMPDSRSFHLQLDGVQHSTITLMRNYSALQVTISPDTEIKTFELVESTNSTLPPLINAYEYYWKVDINTATFSQDIDALNAIKGRFHIKDWISDPCYLIPWEGIGCHGIGEFDADNRISEIDLSGNKLTGSVPDDIEQLTALLTLSLDNNYFTGPMPNVTNLTMLERLYLQNNNFNGTLEWLSKLESLKELNIANNSFSGVIPAKLLVNCSLKLIYSGNPYLRMGKRECILHNLSQNYKSKIGFKAARISGLSALVVFIICFLITMFMWGIYEQIKVYKEEETIMVPIPTKSRAFTRNEMITATQSFSTEIGRGGFGSVFFGKLPEGQLIAVKVLSLFSRQGIKEFLNEVDLLSKINHRNLVSLLGYCNETKEVMLIYEHMSGGSLRDHLHGPSAENSELNWKRRLKIALDAAQGLEYLHVGCTPKIIHRDIKSDNILLNTNLNGKLADFGLSRMTMGEATHVTTGVKGTFGYLDPEYYNTQMLTEKSDMYSFGVVLLEIICGRPPIDLKLAEEKINIVRWVTPYLLEMDENGGEIIEIIDKRLCGGYDIKSITGVANVAMRCVQAVPSSRPSVGEVVAELKEAIKHEDKDSISIAEDIGIQNGDLVAVMAD